MGCRKGTLFQVVPLHLGGVKVRRRFTLNRNLEEEFDALKAGVDTLRKEISSLVGSSGDAATDEVRTRGRRARAVVGRAADRAGEVWDDATNEASRRGREGGAAVEHQIEQRPFISMLLAFGVGVVIGKLIDRSS
jgi:ElaB/YqjD/DUF883 family membrane-anchored ribosome-binding protein